MTASPQPRAGGTIRVLVAKVGYDGHDRGVKVVARILRDAGIEVVYGGLRQTPASLAAAALQEDIDVVGLSMHNGSQLTLAPAVVAALREAGLDTPVVLGGIVPSVDLAELAAAGITEVIGPGASSEEVVAAVERAASRTSP
ncbi:MAG: cobalamin B12-binding domain-containing protein [Acidimicrobiia bacterium]